MADCMPGATTNLVNCLTAATTSLFARDFVYVEGTATPSGVVYRFQKPAGFGSVVRMTIYNGSGTAITSFDDAEVRLNGVLVADHVDFSGQTAFDRDVVLVEGENELRIDAAPGEWGALVVVLANDAFAPPN